MRLVVAILCNTILSLLFLLRFVFAAFLSEFLHSLSGSALLHLFGLHVEKAKFALHADDSTEYGSAGDCGANRFEPDGEHRCREQDPQRLSHIIWR